MRLRLTSAFAVLLCVASMALACAAQEAAAAPQNAGGVPHLQRQGNATQLIVDGKPYLAMGGELSNNAATSLENMDTIWPKLVAGNLNTALIGVTWAQFEPVEGQYNYVQLDGVIAKAQREPHARGPDLVRELEERHVELCAVLGEEGLSTVPADPDQ